MKLRGVLMTDVLKDARKQWISERIYGLVKGYSGTKDGVFYAVLDDYWEGGNTLRYKGMFIDLTGTAYITRKRYRHKNTVQDLLNRTLQDREGGYIQLSEWTGFPCCWDYIDYGPIWVPANSWRFRCLTSLITWLGRLLGLPVYDKNLLPSDKDFHHV